MQSIFNTDSFEAFKISNGIEIKTRGKGALKMAIVIIILGAIFIALSFIDTTRFYSDPEAGYAKVINIIFFYVFRWGGVTMIAAAVLLLVVKGVTPKTETITFDRNKGELHLKGKTIPFSEITDVILQAQPMLGKTMTILMINHNGKKRPFVPPTFTRDQTGFETFVAEIKSMVGAK